MGVEFRDQGGSLIRPLIAYILPTHRSHKMGSLMSAQNTDVKIQMVLTIVYPTGGVPINLRFPLCIPSLA